MIASNLTCMTSSMTYLTYLTFYFITLRNKPVLPSVKFLS